MRENCELLPEVVLRYILEDKVGQKDSLSNIIKYILKMDGHLQLL